MVVPLDLIMPGNTKAIWIQRAEHVQSRGDLAAKSSQEKKKYIYVSYMYSTMK